VNPGCRQKGLRVLFLTAPTASNDFHELNFVTVVVVVVVVV